MAASPQYSAIPKVGIGTLTTANTALNGSGTIATVFTAGTNGSRIDAIEIQATGTTTAGMVRLFVHNGTAAYLIGEIPVVAKTPASSTPAWSAYLSANTLAPQLPIVLPPMWSLRASTERAETFNVIAFGGDF